MGLPGERTAWLSSLSVVKLKEELKDRGLSSAGLKADLQGRLTKALMEAAAEVDEAQGVQEQANTAEEHPPASMMETSIAEEVPMSTQEDIETPAELVPSEPSAAEAITPVEIIAEPLASVPEAELQEAAEEPEKPSATAQIVSHDEAVAAHPDGAEAVAQEAVATAHDGTVSAQAPQEEVLTAQETVAAAQETVAAAQEAVTTAQQPQIKAQPVPTVQKPVIAAQKPAVPAPAAASQPKPVAASQPKPQLTKAAPVVKPAAPVVKAGTLEGVRCFVDGSADQSVTMTVVEVAGKLTLRIKAQKCWVLGPIGKVAVPLLLTSGKDALLKPGDRLAFSQPPAPAPQASQGPLNQKPQQQAPKMAPPQQAQKMAPPQQAPKPAPGVLGKATPAAGTPGYHAVPPPPVNLRPSKIPRTSSGPAPPPWPPHGRGGGIGIGQGMPQNFQGPRPGGLLNTFKPGGSDSWTQQYNRPQVSGPAGNRFGGQIPGPAPPPGGPRPYGAQNGFGYTPGQAAPGPYGGGPGLQAAGMRPQQQGYALPPGAPPAAAQQQFQPPAYASQPAGPAASFQQQYPAAGYQGQATQAAGTAPGYGASTGYGATGYGTVQAAAPAATPSTMYGYDFNAASQAYAAGTAANQQATQGVGALKQMKQQQVQQQQVQHVHQQQAQQQQMMQQQQQQMQQQQAWGQQQQAGGYAAQAQAKAQWAPQVYGAQ